MGCFIDVVVHLGLVVYRFESQCEYRGVNSKLCVKDCKMATTEWNCPECMADARTFDIIWEILLRYPAGGREWDHALVGSICDIRCLPGPVIVHV